VRLRHAHPDERRARPSIARAMSCRGDSSVGPLPLDRVAPLLCTVAATSDGGAVSEPSPLHVVSVSSSSSTRWPGVTRVSADEPSRAKARERSNETRTAP
jgi:hypothetical protein